MRVCLGSQFENVVCHLREGGGVAETSGHPGPEQRETNAVAQLSFSLPPFRQAGTFVDGTTPPTFLSQLNLPENILGEIPSGITKSSHIGNQDDPSQVGYYWVSFYKVCKP